MPQTPTLAAIVPSATSAVVSPYATYPPPEPPTGSLLINGLYFADPQRGWAWASQYDQVNQTHWVVLLRTEDGGLNWALTSAPDAIYQSDAVLSEKPIAQEFNFLSATTGWISAHEPPAIATSDTANTTINVYFVTENGGTTWERRASNTPGLPPILGIDRDWRLVQSNCAPDQGSGDFNCDFEVWFVNDQTQWESAGLNLRGTHGWTATVDSTSGWLLLTSGSQSAGTLAANFLQTVDGGKTWSELPSPPLIHGIYVADSPFAFLQAVDQKTLWLVAGQPVTGIEGTKAIYVSTDGGKTWELRARAGIDPAQRVGEISTFGYIKDFAAVSLTTAFMTLGREGGLDGTFDGGRSWQNAIPLDLAPYANSIYFIDEQYGWVVTRQSVYRTTDGGRTWMSSEHIPGQPAAQTPTVITAIPPEPTFISTPYPAVPSQVTPYP